MSSALSHIGKYELRAVLARTAMSIVYDGWDPFIARRVAVKVIPLSRPEDDDTNEALTRFKRSVQNAGQLMHPNILNIFDYGETDDHAYIVMEFVDGPTLKQLLDSGKRFDISAIRRIMDGILDGLQYGHDRGVVHRNMKPANIMFSQDGRTKITDFGIASLEDSTMTQTGMVIGIPAYMSPEQFMGEKVDWRSDIYAAGAVLYHMITGSLPYDGNVTTIINKVLNSPIPKPSTISATAPPALDQIVMRAMAKEREQRFQSAAEFNAALQAVIASSQEAGMPRSKIHLPPVPKFSKVKAPKKDAFETRHGLVLWNMPERMRVGQPERVEVRLSDADVDETLLRVGLRGRGDPKIDNLTISRLMRVMLVGDEKDFLIKTLSSLDQYVERKEVARWDFLATPLRAGYRILRILISIRLKIEGKDEVYDLPSYEREVHIVVAPFRTFGQFIARNWQWIAATIVIPLIVWAATDPHRAANVFRSLGIPI